MDENNNDELYHHGRLGMKWYQHIYGKAYDHAQYNKKTNSKIKKIKSDTNAEIAKMKKKAKREAQINKAKKASESKINRAKDLIDRKYGTSNKNQNGIKKSVKSDKHKSDQSLDYKKMSNEELIKRTNRMNLERDYINAANSYKKAVNMNQSAKNVSSKQTSRGKSFVTTVGKKVIIPAATNAGKNVLEKWLTNKGEELLGMASKKASKTIKKGLEEGTKQSANQDTLQSRTKELEKRVNKDIAKSQTRTGRKKK